MKYANDMATDGQCLYYYGSLSTLESMLRSKQIWLSDIRKSNDSEEIAYGFRQIKHRLDAVLEPISKGQRSLRIPKDFLEDNHYGSPLTKDEFLERGSILSESLRSIYTQMEIKRGALYAHSSGKHCFALCFTGDGDLLSQWRGYGDNAQGVAIGFDKASILRYVRAHASNAIPHAKLCFCPIYYREMDNAFHDYSKDDIRQFRFLARRFEVTRGRLFREDETGPIDRVIYRMLSELYETSARDETGSFNLEKVFEECEEIVPLLKHPSFYEEREERIFAWADPESYDSYSAGLPNYSSPQLRMSIRENGKLALHFELPIIADLAACDEDHITISRIVLGTRCNAEEQEILALFKQYGLNSRIEVLDSNITYIG